MVAHLILVQTVQVRILVGQQPVLAFCVVIHHIAVNHGRNSLQVSWKIVPAITEV